MNNIRSTMCDPCLCAGTVYEGGDNARNGRSGEANSGGGSQGSNSGTRETRGVHILPRYDLSSTAVSVARLSAPVIV